jgi:putative hemolysin
VREVNIQGIIKGLVPVLLVGLLAACGGEKNGRGAEEPGDQPDTAAEGAPDTGGEKVEVANPASTNCLEQGGELKKMSDEKGEFGVCVFDDGSRCEEWRLFRKECAKGACKAENGICE